MKINYTTRDYLSTIIELSKVGRGVFLQVPNKETWDAVVSYCQKQGIGKAFIITWEERNDENGGNSCDALHINSTSIVYCWIDWFRERTGHEHDKYGVEYRIESKVNT